MIFEVEEDLKQLLSKLNEDMQNFVHISILNDEIGIIKVVLATHQELIN